MLSITEQIRKETRTPPESNGHPADAPKQRSPVALDVAESFARPSFVPSKGTSHVRPLPNGISPLQNGASPQRTDEKTTVTEGELAHRLYAKKALDWAQGEMTEFTNQVLARVASESKRMAGISAPTTTRLSGGPIAALVVGAALCIALVVGSRMFQSLNNTVAQHGRILTKLSGESQKRDHRVDQLDQSLQQATQAVAAAHAQLDRATSRLNEIQNGVSKSQLEIRDLGIRLSRDERAAERLARTQANVQARPQQ